MAAFGGIGCNGVLAWGDYSTNVIDNDYLLPARLRLRINKITM